MVIVMVVMVVVVVVVVVVVRWWLQTVLQCLTLGTPQFPNQGPTL